VTEKTVWKTKEGASLLRKLLRNLPLEEEDKELVRQMQARQTSSQPLPPKTKPTPTSKP
jgi:hypothetical protein